MKTFRSTHREYAGGFTMKKILIISYVLPFILVSALAVFGASFNVVGYEDNELANYSIFATDGVVILGSSTIHSGDVGIESTGMVRSLDAEAEASMELPEKKVSIDQNVYFEYDTSIYGEIVEIKRGASVDCVYYIDLINEGEIRGEEGFLHECAPQVILPEFPEPQPGTDDISVYWFEELVLEPGSYKNVTVMPFGTLILSGGTYHMENLELGYYYARILFRGPTEIVISNKLMSWIKSYIGPEEGYELSAKDICIYVGGVNGGSRYLRNYPKAVQIGRYGKVFANLFAPNGTVSIQRDCIAKGAFIGKDVVIGYGVSVTLDSAKPLHAVTYFTDPNLEAAVREAINKPEGDIYTTDLEQIFALNASGREITDLTGIEGCTNLTNLVLSYNKIIDLGPLAGLVNLVSLNLNENAISDLSPLSDLTNLVRLYLGNNDVSDDTLYSLTGLTNLTTLVLDYNNISDITPLSELTNLNCLVLNDNYIQDLSPLQDLTALTVLYLYNNLIISLEPLQNLTELVTLYLYDNDISELAPLTGLINLTSLVLDYNRIENIGPLCSLKKLTTLYLNDNNIGDISALSGLENLSTLILNTNNIYSIAPLAGMQNISYLNLGYNYISDLTPLEGHIALEVVYLNDNSISSIKALVWNCDAGGLEEGDVVYLNSNPLDEEGVEADITYLTSKGITVYWSVSP